MGANLWRLAEVALTGHTSCEPLGFLNIVVVIVRLFWFKSHLKKLGEIVPSRLHVKEAAENMLPKAPQLHPRRQRDGEEADIEGSPGPSTTGAPDSAGKLPVTAPNGNDASKVAPDQIPPTVDVEAQLARTTAISFDASTEKHRDDATLYIPSPRDRERGETASIPDSYVTADC